MERILDDIYSHLLTFQTVYPVGSVYYTTEEIDPGRLFPMSEWEQLADMTTEDADENEVTVYVWRRTK